NDDTREPLDPAALEVGPNHVMYARVKGGDARARFLRSAYYHLSDRFESDDAAASTSISGVIGIHSGQLIATDDGSSRAESAHRPGTPRDSAEHRLDRASRRRNQSPASSNRSARLLARGSLSQARGAGLLAAGCFAQLRRVGAVR